MTGIERKLTFLGSLWDLKTQTGFHSAALCLSSRSNYCLIQNSFDLVKLGNITCTYMC